MIKLLQSQILKLILLIKLRNSSYHGGVMTPVRYMYVTMTIVMKLQKVPAMVLYCFQRK